MFVGHYGISFAARPVARSVPLWVWFIAVQWLDVVWSILVLQGIEKARITPGFTEANPLDLYYMPYTHGLPGALALSLVVGAVVALCIARSRWRVGLLVAAAAFSHWLLDLIVHTPDLPLYDDTAKVGLGLWRHVSLSLPLEIVVMGAGAWLYARASPAPTRKGTLLFWGFVAALAVLQVYANLGPPPPTPQAMALTALGLYVGLALLAGLIERTTAPAHAG